jgi:superfamily II DNA or RNA helicase
VDAVSAAAVQSLNIEVDGWAWIPITTLSELQLQALKATLTIHPRKVGDHPGDPPSPVRLYSENRFGYLGVPRNFFFANKRAHHVPELKFSEGRMDLWAGPISFGGKLRDEQQQALTSVVSQFENGTYGGIVRAAPGWGKTVFACALIAELRMPALVVVHKEFLMNQWRARIEEYLPGAQIGIAQSDQCDFTDKHVVIGMVHSLAGRNYGPVFREWPGLVITDETHRIGAETWSQVPPSFPAKYRLGISATPRRKDGADNVFLWHIGPILFTAKEQRMKPKVRKVWTEFSLVKTANFNPAYVTKGLVLKIMATNTGRNRLIAEQLVLAFQAGRKVLVLSERLKHLSILEATFRTALKNNNVTEPPSIGYYVGGMTEEQRDEASKAQVLFATKQFAEEGLDIPALDTLFLTMPLGDVEQAVGRIQRPWEGKKDPVVVDFQDDKVPLCVKFAEMRNKFYAKQGWV